MRHKKAPPPLAVPPATTAPSAAPRVDGYDTAASIRIIEQVLSQALRTENDLTPGQFRDLMEMFITDMHLRKSMGLFWMENLPLACEGIRLAGQIEAEFALMKVEGLTPEALKTASGAKDISITQINDLRRKVLEKVMLLKQCPNEGDKIH